jgi:hypothetical protein
LAPFFFNPDFPRHAFPRKDKARQREDKGEVRQRQSKMRVRVRVRVRTVKQKDKTRPFGTPGQKGQKPSAFSYNALFPSWTGEI